MLSWTRGFLAALALGALLSAGPAGCGPDGAREGTERKAAEPVGRLLDRADEEGRRYREVDEKGAPEVGVEVQPDTGGDWDIRLTVRRFRFSPPGTEPRAVPGRGHVRLLVDGRPVALLRTPRYRLPARLVPRGTHHVTARLHADDDTVWATDGAPIQRTADITASPVESPVESPGESLRGSPGGAPGGSPGGSPAE
ncbi:hypothetical protein [Streptomyces thermoalcalitolerans]